MKKTNIRRKIVISILVLSTFFYGALVLIPMVAGNDMSPGTGFQTQHTWFTAFYRLDVTEGNVYKVTIHSSSFWDVDPIIEVYSNSKVDINGLY